MLSFYVKMPNSYRNLLLCNKILADKEGIFKRKNPRILKQLFSRMEIKDLKMWVIVQNYINKENTVF